MNFHQAFFDELEKVAYNMAAANKAYQAAKGKLITTGFREGWGGIDPVSNKGKSRNSFFGTIGKRFHRSHDFTTLKKSNPGVAKETQSLLKPHEGKAFAIGQASRYMAKHNIKAPKLSPSGQHALNKSVAAHEVDERRAVRRGGHSFSSHQGLMPIMRDRNRGLTASDKGTREAGDYMAKVRGAEWNELHRNLPDLKRGGYDANSGKRMSRHMIKSLDRIRDRKINAGQWSKD